mgnify:CR=1 FL=1
MQAKILFVFFYKKIEAGQPDGAASLRRHAQINSIRFLKPYLYNSTFVSASDFTENFFSMV